MALSKTTLLVTAAAAAAAWASAPASAQYYGRNNNVAVRERPQPGYDPVGVPVGAFRAYLSAPVGAVYNSNVFAVDDDPTTTDDDAIAEVDDIIITVRPNLTVESQWSNHELRFFANAEHFSHSDFDEETRTSVSAGLGGRLDIQRGFIADGEFVQGWRQEDRSDPSSPRDALEPVSYETQETELTLAKEFNRLRLTGGGSYYEADYDDALDRNGFVVDQDGRDHEAIRWLGRVDYALTPSTAVFASATTTDRSYVLSPLDDPINIPLSREAKGQRYLVGADFDITNLIRGHVSFGALEEDFLDPEVDDLSGFAASARVEWFPTPLATVELVGERAVTETGVAGAAAALTTTVSARVDYEVQRNLILSGQLRASKDDFEGVRDAVGTPLDRDDLGVAAAVDLLFLLNEHVGASFTVQHSERSSDGLDAGPEFTQEIVGLNLVLRY